MLRVERVDQSHVFGGRPTTTSATQVSEKNDGRMLQTNKLCSVIPRQLPALSHLTVVFMAHSHFNLSANVLIYLIEYLVREEVT